MPQQITTRALAAAMAELGVRSPGIRTPGIRTPGIKTPRIVARSVVALGIAAGAGIANAQIDDASDDGWQCSNYLEGGALVRICKPLPDGESKPLAVGEPKPLAVGEPKPLAVGEPKPPAVGEPKPASSTTTTSSAAAFDSTAPAAQSPAEQITSQPAVNSQAAANRRTAPVAAADAVTTAQPDCGRAALSEAQIAQSEADTQASLDLQSQLPVEAIADQVAIEAHVAQFSGQVEFNRGTSHLQAERATYNRETQIVQLQDHVVATTPFATVRGEQAELNLSNNSSRVAEAQYVLTQNGMYGSAASISIAPDKRVTIERGSYTRCQPQRKLWEVQADTIKLDPQSGQGSARDATLRIANLPVLYLPYARFPIGDQRQSGLLFPRLASTNGSLDFTLPYYFNLAPNLDFTFAPRYKQHSGYVTEGELRWLNHFDEWQLGGAYIDNDEEFGDSRWLIDVAERGALGNGLSSSIKFTKISDADYLRDLDTNSLSISRATHLEQRATLNYHHKLWSAGASLRKYQTIDASLSGADLPYETTPDLWLNYRSLPRLFKPGANAELRFASYEQNSRLEGARSYAQLEFDLPMRWAGVSLEPALGFQYLGYQLSNLAAAGAPATQDENPDFSAAYGSLNMQAVFEKPRRREQQLVAIKTLTPRLRYLYRDIVQHRSAQQNVPRFDSDWLTVNTNTLYRDSRFSGYDIIEDGNQLAASLTHQRRSTTSAQQLSLTLGQIFYFQNMAADRSVTGTASQQTRRSALLGDANWSNGRGLTGLAAVQWDSERNVLEHGALAWRYRAPASRQHARGISLANLGYSYRNSEPGQVLLASNIEQLDASVVSAISRRWGLLGRYQYDLTHSRSVESLAGLQFDDCCLQLRLVYRNGLVYDPDSLAAGGGATSAQRDRSVYLQIEFKGLAGVGRALENVLEESIFGYRTP